MGKVAGTKTDFRLVVYPRGLGEGRGFSVSDTLIYGHGKEGAARIEKEYQARCEEISAEIKRHVDDVANVCIEFEQPNVCEHCGWLWTEESTVYNGGCCDKDEANNPETKVTA